MHAYRFEYVFTAITQHRLVVIAVARPTSVAFAKNRGVEFSCWEFLIENKIWFLAADSEAQINKHLKRYEATEERHTLFHFPFETLYQIATE